MVQLSSVSRIGSFMHTTNNYSFSVSMGYSEAFVSTGSLLNVVKLNMGGGLRIYCNKGGRGFRGMITGFTITWCGCGVIAVRLWIPLHVPRQNFLLWGGKAGGGPLRAAKGCPQRGKNMRTKVACVYRGSNEICFPNEECQWSYQGTNRYENRSKERPCPPRGSGGRKRLLPNKDATRG